ncbi:MAG: hypothetical protein LBM96_01970 [Methanobrevibacter sp.]|jgi:hypothetical protein|nr:hypothetical protein [Candidatus Methanoflexus mossambicus]
MVEERKLSYLISPEMLIEYFDELRNKLSENSEKKRERKEIEEEGRKEARNDVALKLKKEGSDIKFISKITGLTFDEIKKL